MSSSWHSYPSIYNMGHRAIADLLKGPVNVEEKVDGSQFSFGKFMIPDTDGHEYELRCKSKGAFVNPLAPPAMFRGAVDTAQRLFSLLNPEWTYRGEVLAKPKHNTLAYDRVPAGNFILFDVNLGEQDYLSYEDKVAEAQRLGLEVVDRIYAGIVPDVQFFRAMLERTSCLGGQKIEGVVVKPMAYDLYGIDKKVLMGKFVSEEFREIHVKAWRESNPTRSDIVERIIEELSTPARFNKALIHLKERGEIEGAPRDIGKLIKEVEEDLQKEVRDHVAQRLLSHFLPQIVRGAIRPVPEWYKQHLLNQQFEQEAKSGE